MSIVYPKDWPVLYKGTKLATIEAVHNNTDEVYYTIHLLEDKREKQTVQKYLSSWIDNESIEYKIQTFKGFKKP
jgi:hypothetical protein